MICVRPENTPGFKKLEPVQKESEGGSRRPTRARTGGGCNCHKDDDEKDNDFLSVQVRKDILEAAKTLVVAREREEEEAGAEVGIRQLSLSCLHFHFLAGGCQTG